MTYPTTPAGYESARTSLRAAVDRIERILGAAEGRTLTNSQQSDMTSAFDDWTDAGAMFSIPSFDSLTKTYGKRAMAEAHRLADGAQTPIEERAAAIEARAKYEPIVGSLGNGGSTTYGSGREYVYQPNSGPSFFADLYASTRGDSDAAQRLTRHNHLSSETRAGTTGLTSFGAFIPPAWILDEYAGLPRPGRVIADIIRDGGPPTSDSMQIPRVTTGSAVAIQATENTTLGTVDAVVANITLPTSTIGGYVDTSVQSLELGTYQTDRLIVGDLQADYQKTLDSQLIIGTGASNQLLGLDAITGVNSQTYTDASPTVAKVFSQVAQAVNLVNTSRYAPPDAIVMHPRRWAWILATADSTGRPLVDASGPIVNGLATATSPTAGGAAGQMLGLPVYVDANIPTTIGATQDEIYVIRGADMILFESEPRAETFRDVGSANATVRFRLYAFVNAFLGRYPTGISRIRGTGLTTPVFP